MTSLEDAISDKDKQISNLRDQRDRAEQERNEERDLHERQIAEIKMKYHSIENNLEKLQVNFLFYRNIILILFKLKLLCFWNETDTFGEKFSGKRSCRD